MKVYFEAGANDGVAQSRTHKYKDDSNWVGILVEPDSRCIDSLIRNRHSTQVHIYQCALVPNNDITSVTLYKHSTPLMNMVQGTVRGEQEGKGLETFVVRGRTVQSILNDLEIDTIDEMYLDVEGYEREVMKGIDPKTTIHFLEVECHYHDKPEKEEELNEILEQGERLGLVFKRINYDDGHPKVEFISK